MEDPVLLQPKTQLELYLVREGMKPACTFDIDLITTNPIITESDEMTLYIHDVSEETLDYVGQYVLRKTKAASLEVETKESLGDSDGKPFKRTWPVICVKAGGNNQQLEQLLQATTHKEIGCALGYPEIDIEGFEQEIGGVLVNERYYWVEIAKAHQQGITIPEWLAYISHVPKEFSIVEENMGRHAEALGTTYQSFTQRNNRALARLVEEDFNTTNLPYKWTIHEGVYHLHYDYGGTEMEISVDY